MIGGREIGGYLELECFRGPMLHEGDIALNCGRACLEYLIELRGICTLWLPDFLCSSVPSLCCKAGVEAKTYHIGESFRAMLDFQIAEEEWLYLVDYYGQLTQGDVDEALAASGGRLIIDESQGYYREPWLGADTLYTCRKWFGVADGAFLHTKDGAKLARTLPRSESFDKMGFLLGRFERSAGEFFTDSKINNVRFADEPMAKTMSFQREYAEPYDWVAQQFKDWAFTLTTAILYYNDYDSIDEDARGLYRKAMAAFGGIAPSYHIELLDKPTIYWDFHSLLLGIQMMFSFMLVDGDQPLRLCKHCQKVFLGSRSNAAFCSPRCKNQYNVYKSRGKNRTDGGDEE